MAEYLIQEETLTELANVIRGKIGWDEHIVNLVSSRTNLKQVSLPEGLKTIGEGAFRFCNNLVLEAIPESVDTIKKSAFVYCRNITISSLPEGLKSIGLSAFDGCTNLTDITFQGTPTSVADNAFADCPNLTTINVPWSEGEVAGAPWGATNATINYEYAEEGTK